MKYPLPPEKLQEIQSWAIHGKPSTFCEPPHWEYMPKFPKTLSTLQADPSVKRVLDIGCYTGYLGVRLVKEGYSYVGIDLQDELMLGLDREAVRKNVKARFYFQDASTMDKRFKVGEFDAVVILDSLEHMLDDQAVLAQAERVVRPGGLVIVHLPLDHLYGEPPSEEHVFGYTDEEIRSLFGQKRGVTIEPCSDEQKRPTVFITYRVGEGGMV